MLFFQFGCLATAYIYFSLDIYVFGKRSGFKKHTQHNFLEFCDSHVTLSCEDVTTTKMVFIVSVYLSFSGISINAQNRLKGDHRNSILFQAIESYPNIFDASYCLLIRPAIIQIILLINICYKPVISCLYYH